MRLIDRILSALKPYRAPSPVKSFTAEVDSMSNVRLRWKLPTPSPRQRAIARTVIDGRVSPSLPWTTLNTVDAPGETLLLTDHPPGSWEFCATVVDVGNVSSSSVTTSIDLAFDPPSPATNFTAVVE